MNLQDVVALAQKYTTIPVEVVTANETTTVAEQIKLFNSFDVLITAHGSHLANGIFTMNPQQKVYLYPVSNPLLNPLYLILEGLPHI